MDVASNDSDTESVVSSVSDFEIGQGKKKKTISKFLGGISKVRFVGPKG